MKPPKREMDYEKVKTGDFITGVIEDIQYDMEHKFKYQGNVKEAPAVRFIFKLEGYEHKHYSRWMTFSYGEKTNLYKKYLVSLVNGMIPDCNFDLDKVKGMKVKTIWQEQNNFQSIELIRPFDKKLDFVPEPEPDDANLSAEPEESDEIPF